MDRVKAGTLTPVEAKERLQSIAGRIGPVAWIREKPRQSLGIALLAGMIVGNTSKTQENVANSLISMLINTHR